MKVKSIYLCVIVIVFGMALVGSISTTTLLQQQAAAQGQAPTGSQQTNTNQNMSNVIPINVTEQNEVYRWSNTEGINPTLKFLKNTNNTVQIQNPTDEKHEMVIESQGNELASSGDIAPGATAQLVFNPNMTGTFGYHCEYHPDTMKGIIMVS